MKELIWSYFWRKEPAVHADPRRLNVENDGLARLPEGDCNPQNDIETWAEPNTESQDKVTEYQSNEKDKIMGLRKDVTYLLNTVEQLQKNGGDRDSSRGLIKFLCDEATELKEKVKMLKDKIKGYEFKIEEQGETMEQQAKAIESYENGKLLQIEAVMFSSYNPQFAQVADEQVADEDDAYTTDCTGNALDM